jgi:CubicO group peptidase (beta-lactamase class C family)
MSGLVDYSCILALASATVLGGLPLRCHAQVSGARLAAAADSVLKSRAAAGWSGAVIIEYKGEVILSSGFGKANRERNVPFTTNTIAQVGSLTKQFTAAAVATLAKDGRLSFTDQLSKHLPEVRGVMRTVTLHELLTHSSGLAENCGRDFERVTAADIMSRCLNDAQLKSRGSYAYSNLGYSVLGIVVERVSRQSLEAYLEARFFRPLGLNIAYTFEGLPATSAPAVCYLNGRPQQPIAERITELNGAYWMLKGNGGMQASVEDMYKWYRALREAKALPPDALRSLLAPHVPHTQAGISYGYGWNVRVDSVGRVVLASHSGSDGVCWAAIIWRPVDDGFIYIAGNSDTRASSEIASALLRLMREASGRGA